MIPLHRSIFKELDQIAEEMFTPKTARVSAQKSSTPLVRITETKDAYLIELLAYGRQKENFEITVDKNLLIIQSNEIAPEKNDDNKIIHNEFTVPALKRVFTIDETIDSSSVTASYNAGILTIQLNKKAAPVLEKKKISVS
jgi:HSP20 family protein